MDGIIVFDKPARITSAGALYRVRKITGRRKSGHAGTLDPAATGVLVLCLGKATRLCESIMDQPKVYRATARLDVTSASFDSDATLEAVEVHKVPDRDEIEAAIAKFEGTIQQVPPRVSAVKVGGMPAYKRHRLGHSFELKARSARVYWIVVHRFAWPELDFEMCCGRGTYVRSIIRDLGTALGAGGCLTSLVRSRVGPFFLDDSWTFDSLEAAADQALLDSPGSTTACPKFLIELDEARRLLAPDAMVIPERPATGP